MSKQSHRRLRFALLANALFSAFSGLLILFAQPLVLNWLGLEQASIWPVGAVLLLFAVSLWWMSRAIDLPVAQVKSVIYSDWAWVAGTAALLLWKAQWFSSLGQWLLIDIAAVVGLLALWQANGLRRAMNDTV